MRKGVRVKVLFVDHTSDVSGAQRALVDLVTALPAGVEPTVLCPPGELSDMLEREAGPTRAFRGTTGSLRLHPAQTPAALAELLAGGVAVRRAAAAVGADLVHANSIRAGIMGAVAARLGGPPLVTHVHDCLPRTRAADAVCRLLATRSAAVIAVSAYTARVFDRGRAPRRAYTLYNPVDFSAFDPAALTHEAARAQLGLDGRPTFGVVAQITPWKGQHVAVEALARVRERAPDAQLLIVGSTKFVSRATRFDNRTYERELHALVGRLGLRDAVHFWGERRDVPRVLRALDALLVPSDEEPLGRVIIEAMAMQTPVIATTVGGPPEVIEDGVTGLLAPPGAPERWADQLARVLEDPAWTRAVARRGRESVTARFDRDRYVDLVLGVYRDVLGGPATSS